MHNFPKEEKNRKLQEIHKLKKSLKKIYKQKKWIINILWLIKWYKLAFINSSNYSYNKKRERSPLINIKKGLSILNIEKIKDGLKKWNNVNIKTIESINLKYR